MSSDGVASEEYLELSVDVHSIPLRTSFRGFTDIAENFIPKRKQCNAINNNYSQDSPVDTCTSDDLGSKGNPSTIVQSESVRVRVRESSVSSSRDKDIKSDGNGNLNGSDSEIISATETIIENPPSIPTHCNSTVSTTKSSNNNDNNNDNNDLLEATFRGRAFIGKLVTIPSNVDITCDSTSQFNENLKNENNNNNGSQHIISVTSKTEYEGKVLLLPSCTSSVLRKLRCLGASDTKGQSTSAGDTVSGVSCAPFRGFNHDDDDSQLPSFDFSSPPAVSSNDILKKEYNNNNIKNDNDIEKVDEDHVMFLASLKGGVDLHFPTLPGVTFKHDSQETLKDYHLHCNNNNNSVLSTQTYTPLMAGGISQPFDVYPFPLNTSTYSEDTLRNAAEESIICIPAHTALKHYSAPSSHEAQSLPSIGCNAEVYHSFNRYVVWEHDYAPSVIETEGPLKWLEVADVLHAPV